jgi:hypothetical protein
VLGADGGFAGSGVGAGLSAGGCSEEEEPVSEPHQRLTRLPLDALWPVSAFAVVVHWPEVPAVLAGVSLAGAAAA